jgi:hypothetical protein
VDTTPAPGGSHLRLEDGGSVYLPDPTAGLLVHKTLGRMEPVRWLRGEECIEVAVQKEVGERRAVRYGLDA